MTPPQERSRSPAPAHPKEPSQQHADDPRNVRKRVSVSPRRMTKPDLGNTESAVPIKETAAKHKGATDKGAPGLLKPKLEAPMTTTAVAGVPEQEIAAAVDTGPTASEPSGSGEKKPVPEDSSFTNID